MEVVNESTVIAGVMISVARVYIAARVGVNSMENVNPRRTREEYVTKRPCARMTARRSGTGPVENVLNDILMTFPYILN